MARKRFPGLVDKTGCCDMKIIALFKFTSSDPGSEDLSLDMQGGRCYFLNKTQSVFNNPDKAEPFARKGGKQRVFSEDKTPEVSKNMPFVF
jgi:hypothetical protein